jgi:hypothetical protein
MRRQPPRAEPGKGSSVSRHSPPCGRWVERGHHQSKRPYRSSGRWTCQFRKSDIGRLELFHIWRSLAAMRSLAAAVGRGLQTPTRLLLGTKFRSRRFDVREFLVRKRPSFDRLQIRTSGAFRAKTCPLRLTNVHVTHASQLRVLPAIALFRRFAPDSTEGGFSSNQNEGQHNIDLFRICRVSSGDRSDCKLPSPEERALSHSWEPVLERREGRGRGMREDKNLFRKSGSTRFEKGDLFSSFQKSAPRKA